MFDEYVCKIQVSKTNCFTTYLEGTAFGFDDGEKLKILTAGHVITNALGGNYPACNTVKLFVIFYNYKGQINTTPIQVDFTLNHKNNQSNFIVNNHMPLYDSAEIDVLELLPVSKYFRKNKVSCNDQVIGIGYPKKNKQIYLLNDSIYGIYPCHIQGESCTRYIVMNDSHEGCSGGPYVKKENEEFFVIGSLIGKISDDSNTPHNSLQSAEDF